MFSCGDRNEAIKEWRANTTFKLYYVGHQHAHIHTHACLKAFDSLPNDLRSSNTPTTLHSLARTLQHTLSFFFLSKRDKDLVKVVRGISFSAEMRPEIASVLQAD